MLQLFFENPSISSVIDGDHAWEVSKQLNSWIERRTNNNGVLHIFVASPVSIMFNLGKMSLAYGKGRIYDYNYEKDKSKPGTYYPKKDFVKVIKCNF
jgi:hypothetical protein